MTNDNMNERVSELYIDDINFVCIIAFLHDLN